MPFPSLIKLVKCIEESNDIYGIQVNWPCIHWITLKLVIFVTNYENCSNFLVKCSGFPYSNYDEIGLVLYLM